MKEKEERALREGNKAEIALLDAEIAELEKAFGRKDLSKLHKEVITDKNGRKMTVWKRNEQRQAARGRGIAGERKPASSRRAAAGDRVSFMKEGRLLQGVVTARGNLGVTVRGEGEAKGVLYQVPHADVKAVRRLENPEFLKGGWRGTDGMQPEYCDTIEGLYKTVEAAREEFSNLSEGLKRRFAALNPVLMKRSKLKGEARIKEKLREDQAESDYKASLKGEETKPEYYDEQTDTYHCRTIRDCDGHTLCLKSADDVEKVAEYLNRLPYVVRVKNNFAKPSPVGYSDINMNIRLSNGAIVEMQLNTAANLVAKERYGHALYEVYRSVESNPKHGRLAELMADAQKALYGLSSKYSREGNFPSAGDVFSDNYRHEPYAEAIRRQVKEALPLYRKARDEGLLNEKTIEHFEHLVEFIR